VCGGRGHPRVERSAATAALPEGTTSAEQEIIDAVLQGRTVKEIAGQRGASLRTVTTQLGTIFRKAGVNSQAELIALITDDAHPE